MLNSFSCQFLICFLQLVIAGAGSLSATESYTDFDEWEIGDFEERLETIDGELEKLASLSLRSGVGAVGYRSETHETSDHLESIEIDLEVAVVIDEVVLVPCIWRDSKSGFRADGFPEEFRIIAGLEGDEEGQVVASFKKEDQILPRIAPLVIPCNEVKASWVRI